MKQNLTMPSDNTSKRNSVIAAIAVLLLIGTGIYLTVQMGRSSRLESELKNEKLNAESLLSQKLALDKEIAKLKTDIKEKEALSTDLNRMLTENSRKLEAAELEAQKSKKQNSSIAELKKKNSELLRQKEEIDQQINNFRNSLNQLQSSNDDLEKTVAQLQKQNKELTDELNAMRLASMNDLLVETSKKNNKQTVKARRTKNLVVNVDVSSKAENLSFKVISPSGKELTDKEGTLSIKTISENKASSKAFYVAGGSAVPQPTYNRVQMSYSAKEKLSPGIYKIEVLSNLESIGSLQVKLR